MAERGERGWLRFSARALLLGLLGLRGHGRVPTSGWLRRAGGGFPFPGLGGGVFKPGEASAQVTASVCSPYPFPHGCSSSSTDAIIRLAK